MILDDAELYKSDSLSAAFPLARTIKFSVSDVKVRVVQNKLQLCDEKTEILLIGSAPGTDLSSLLRVDLRDIPFSSAARKLGVVFHSHLPLKEEVNKLCQRPIRRSGGSVQTDSIFLLKPPELLWFVSISNICPLSVLGFFFSSVCVCVCVRARAHVRHCALEKCVRACVRVRWRHL